MNFFYKPYRNTNSKKTYESFCCYDTSELKDGKLQCKCGETVGIYDWSWEKQPGNAVVLSDDSREVVFHPIYSSGTAAVRGSVPFQQNRHHYWEIKVLTNLYGTDIMVGVGTSSVSLRERQFKFCSMLGHDSQSWGYSYHGVIQHDKMVRKYGGMFGMGSIIGIHVDMFSGTLEYYLNRKPLGIAFKGLKGFEIYPIVSSTAAQSALRMTCSLTMPSTLQLKCLMVIKKHAKLLNDYRSIPGLSRLMRREYFWIIPPEIEDQKDKNALTFEDEVVLQLSSVVQKTKKYRKRLRTDAWSIFQGARADPDHRSYGDFVRSLDREADEEEIYEWKLRLGKYQEQLRKDDEAEGGSARCCAHDCVKTAAGTSAASDLGEPNDLLVHSLESEFIRSVKTLSSTIDMIKDITRGVVSTDQGPCCVRHDLDQQGASSSDGGRTLGSTKRAKYRRGGANAVKKVCCVHTCTKYAATVLSDDDDNLIVKRDNLLSIANGGDDTGSVVGDDIDPSNGDHLHFNEPLSSPMIYEDIDDESSTERGTSPATNKMPVAVDLDDETSEDSLCSACNEILYDV